MLEVELIADELIKRQSQRHFFTSSLAKTHSSATGDCPREEKHLEFFEAGAKYRERCFMAGNRIGKTTTASYELTFHLTGFYIPNVGGASVQ